MSAAVSRKVLGERAECVFLAQATQRGLIVSKPYGDSAPYDFIVEKRKDHRRDRRGKQRTQGKLWKVQVKSVWKRSPGHTYQAVTRHCTARYQPGEVDFFAAWVAPWNAWYIIPADQVIPRTMIGLYPQGPKLKGLYEKYREAWELLGAVDSE